MKIDPEASNPVEENRIGKFYITKYAIDEAPQVVIGLLSSILVVKCEFIYHKNSFEYFGYSNLFEKVNYAGVPNEYQIDITKTHCEDSGDVDYSFSVKKI